MAVHDPGGGGTSDLEHRLSAASGPSVVALPIEARRERYRQVGGRLFESFVLIDSTGVILDAVDVEWLGYDSAAVIGTNTFDLIPPEELDRAAIELLKELGGGNRGPGVTLRVRRGDGAWSSVEVFGVNQLEVDDIGAVLLMIHDVTGRPVADRVLAAGEYLYRNLATTATDFTIITNAELEPLYVSPSITAVLGWQAAQLSVPRPFGLTHSDDRRRMENEVDAALAAPGSARRIDARCRRSDGSHVWIDFTIVNLLDDPVIEGLVFHARNIDERRRAADQLFHLALHDPLTGLPNRQHFVDHLDALMLEPDVASVTVLYCDLVDFKPVNDHHGHAAGDELLRHAGQRLRRAVRPDDLVARVGGDEFCIVCTDIDVDRAQELGQRVLRAFDEPVELEGLTVAVGISVGVARASGGGRSADLLRRADEAMYRAKARGRNTLHLSDS